MAGRVWTFGYLDICDFTCSRWVQRKQRQSERERETDFGRDRDPNQTHKARVLSFVCIHAAAYAVCPTIA